MKAQPEISWLMNWVVGIFFVAGPLMGQTTTVISTPSEEGENATALRGAEILQQLLETCEFSSESEMVDTWLRELRNEFGPENPLILKALHSSGLTFYNQGKYQESLRLFRQQYELATKVLGKEHPNTLTALNNLAQLVKESGSLNEALALQKQVLENRIRILGEQHPDTLIARANRATTIFSLGDLARSKKNYAELLEFSIRILGEEHPDTLTTKGNLAQILNHLGDLVGARKHQEEVLDASNRILGEEHPSTLIAKSNLASTLYDIEDFLGAKRLQEEMLVIITKNLGESHPYSLTARANLGKSLYSLGELTDARKLQEEVLAASNRVLGEEHLSTVNVRANLATTLHSLKELATAKSHYEAVLEVRTRVLGADHPETLLTLHNLATTTLEIGDLDTASLLYERVIQIRQKVLGPKHRSETIEEANTFLYLGLAQKKLGRFDESYKNFLSGLDALEAQILRLDLSEESKVKYKADQKLAYQEALGTCLKRQKPEDALQILERYRTESLLTLLRWSRPEHDERIPETYREELAQIATRYDWLTRELDDLYPHTNQDYLNEQKTLRRRRAVIQGEIIEARRAQEGPHQTLTVDEIQAHLDPGALLLAYSIGNEESWIFTLTHEGPLKVHPVETEALRLWLQVGRLRKIDLGNPEQESPEARQNLSQWLYEKLLAQVAHRIEKAERLLIIPDGPLHYLHFPALTRPAKGTQKGWQYLVEWKPIHTVQSATVYAELQARRDPQPETDQATFQWVGFGNPVYPVKADEAHTRDVLRDSKDRGIWDGLEELPYTHREIEGIAIQFPKGQAKAHLLHQATEDQARKILGNTRIAHFATHGLAHPEHPLDSFLALSLDVEGTEQNGLLQAWEIIDHIKLNADLVVLSACVTAFGPNRGGEGLISLSRAFQIAGARTVMASLWAVNDASTSELMIRFYKHLLAGKSKDKALQAAQLELIQGPVMVENAEGVMEEKDYSDPYHWAAFQLIGDWQ